MESFCDQENESTNRWSETLNILRTDTINTFKNKLDKFWQDQPIILDFKVEIQGTEAEVGIRLY